MESRKIKPLMFVLAVTIFIFSTILSAQAQDFYAPSSPKSDSTHMLRLMYGNYVFLGIGGAKSYHIGARSILLNYSLAYKTHVFSLSYIGYTIPAYGGGDLEPLADGGYLGLLAGEAIRTESGFIGLSSGLAYSETDLWYPDGKTPTSMASYDRTGISCPVELKFFLLAKNGIGFGFYFSENLIPQMKYAPSCFGISIVLGKWNGKVKN